MSSTLSRLARALYRLQTVAGLTGPEARAAVVLVVMLAGGLAAQALVSADTAPVPDFYAAADAAFLAAPRADSADAAPAAPVAGAAAPVPADTASAAVQAVVARRAAPTPAAPVRVNTATAAELVALPGIGPATAARLVEARPFRDIADLEARVRGIGPTKAARLAPLVRF